jgi:hypothetical protein
MLQLSRQLSLSATFPRQELRWTFNFYYGVLLLVTTCFVIPVMSKLLASPLFSNESDSAGDHDSQQERNELGCKLK